MKTLLALLALIGQELAIMSGGVRIVDRDPLSATSNCSGWVYGPSPLRDESGAITSMYTVSDRLTDHCAHSIESALRFGDSIQLHTKIPEGGWTTGRSVIGRESFWWMSDHEFVAAYPQSYIGHLSSPSVIKRDGRYFMAFVGSVDDRNLCAAEHTAVTTCGSCSDPWSYFVAMWAVSDDGIHWHVRERASADAMLIGRPPDDADLLRGSHYKGVTRVSLVEHEGYFYIGAQFWSRSHIKMMMFRFPYDAADQWGIGGDAEVWHSRQATWLRMEEGRIPDLFATTNDSSLTLALPFSSITRVRLFAKEQYLGLASWSGSPGTGGSRPASAVWYFTSDDLVNWRGSQVSSAIRDFADGYGYEASVIDPIAMEDADGRIHLFLASADGDEVHGVGRNGEHDCWLDPNIPTAPYVGTGIYEAILEETTRRPTSMRVTARDAVVPPHGMARFDIEVTSEDGSIPEGYIFVSAGPETAHVRLNEGRASVELRMIFRGEMTVWASYNAQGIWERSIAAAKVNVVSKKRRALN